MPGFLTHALPGFSQRQGDDVRADSRVVEAVEDRIGAGAYLLRRALAVELSGQLGQELGEAHLVGGGVGADLFEVLVDERLYAVLDRIANPAHVLERPPRRIGDRPLLDGRWYVWAGVTARSACNCISRVSLSGLRPERSIPMSSITWLTSGQIARAGCVPADSARTFAGLSRSE